MPTKTAGKTPANTITADDLLTFLIDIAIECVCEPTSGRFRTEAALPALTERFGPVARPLAKLRENHFVRVCDDVAEVTTPGLRHHRDRIVAAGLTEPDDQLMSGPATILRSVMTGDWSCVKCGNKVTPETGVIESAPARLRRWKMDQHSIASLCPQCVLGRPNVGDTATRKRLTKFLDARKAAWPDIARALDGVKLNERQREAVELAYEHHLIDVDPATIIERVKAVWDDVMEFAKGQYPYSADEYGDRDEWWEEVLKDEAAKQLAEQLAD